jgi:predicted 3-demethylubiquinone-9 3-methyltransferase (glyoxalase superfamily)
VPRIVPNLWFDAQALEAAEFYCGIFPNSEITGVEHYSEAGPGEPGSVFIVAFTLDGQPFMAINGGPQFPFTEAISLQVDCADQAEIDRYWAALTDGGQEVQCGWLKDRFGLSWQVAPADMGGLLFSDDPERARRATEAMMGMVKIDIAAIVAAADG